jgi:hypothetical protein
MGDFDFRNMMGGQKTPEPSEAARQRMLAGQRAGLALLPSVQVICDRTGSHPEFAIGFLMSVTTTAMADQNGKAAALKMLSDWRDLIDMLENTVASRG